MSTCLRELDVRCGGGLVVCCAVELVVGCCVVELVVELGELVVELVVSCCVGELAVSCCVGELGLVVGKALVMPTPATVIQS